MKYLKQFFCLLFFLLLGDIIERFTGLPAAAMAMALFFIALLSGLAKLAWAEETGQYLLQAAPVFFTPLLVNAMLYKDVISPILLKLCLTVLCSTLVTLAAVGWAVQILDWSKERRP